MMMYLGENTNHGQISLDTPLKTLPCFVSLRTISGVLLQQQCHHRWRMTKLIDRNQGFNKSNPFPSLLPQNELVLTC